jgi:hypothetical protein
MLIKIRLSYLEFNIWRKFFSGTPGGPCKRLSVSALCDVGGPPDFCLTALNPSLSSLQQSASSSVFPKLLNSTQYTLADEYEYHSQTETSAPI